MCDGTAVAKRRRAARTGQHASHLPHLMNAISSSHDPSPHSSGGRSFQRWLTTAQPLTFSALIHAVVIVILGGTVLLKVHQEPPDFVAEGGGLVSVDELKIV